MYLDDVDRAIAAVPELSQIYTLHVQLSIRLFDLLTIHVECPTAVYEAILSDPLYKQLLLDRIRIQFGIHTCLVWSPIEISTPPPIDCETSVTRDMEQYAARMCGKRDHAMSVMDGPPEVVFYAPGNLPRNSRTGKMPKIIDLRK